MSREFKVVPLGEFKLAGEGYTGEFSGRASTFGTIDKHADTVEPGAYKDTLPQFLSRGFIGWGHDWDNPIGYVTSAEERSDGLYISGKFHTDPEAQRRRQIAKERLDAGLFMGLSIGYEVKEAGERQVEQPVPGKFGLMTNTVRVLKKLDLFEVSLVMVPAEAHSGLSSIKGDGLSFDDHLERVRVALEEVCRRCESGSETREKVGRAISLARREKIEGFIGSMGSLLDELRALVADEPSGSEDEAAEPVVGLDAEIPEDMKRWVAHWHHLNREFS